MLKKKLLLTCCLAAFFAACVSDPTPNTCATEVESSQKIAHCGAPAPAPAAKCTVNVYVENSGSMDGYVKPGYDGSQFKQLLHQMLTECHNQDCVQEVNAGYINMEMLPMRTMNDFRDIDEFSQVSVAKFKKEGGNRKTTSFSNLFDMILGNQQANAVSVVFSDCISDEPLSQMQDNMKSIFGKYRDKDLMVVVLQSVSAFDGTYYCGSYSKPIKGDRPFYVWIVGATAHVDRLMEEVALKGVQHRCTLLSKTKAPQYTVTAGMGNYKFTPPHTISKWKRDQVSKKATLTLNADFSGMPLEAVYFLDKKNYGWDKQKFDFEITAAPKGIYTHTIKIAAPQPFVGKLTLKLNRRMPAWVRQMNDSDGTDIAQAMGQTYGIAAMIQGVLDAFGKNGPYATMEITIK